MKKLIYTLHIVLGLLVIDFTNAYSNTATHTSFSEENPVTAEMRRVAYITQLYHAFDPICQKYGINTKVAITQAIVEQGWTLRKDYRIFNIMSVSKHDSKVVYDHGEKRYRRYKVYASLEEAVEDYCKVLSSYPTYRANGLFKSVDPKKQIKAIVKGGYATNPRYEELSMSVLDRFVSPLVDELRTDQALRNQNGFKQETGFMSYQIGSNTTKMQLPMD